MDATFGVVSWFWSRSTHRSDQRVNSLLNSRCRAGMFGGAEDNQTPL